MLQGNSFAATVAGYYAVQILDDLWTSSPTSFSVLNNTSWQGILVRVTHGTTKISGNSNVANGGGAAPSGTTPPRTTPVPAGTIRTPGVG